jgi:putative protein kinase ArgK-like GTPase of G3E family
MKAGIMEIGDIFVINKSDLQEPNNCLQNKSYSRTFWKAIASSETDSIKGSGLKELFKKIEEVLADFANSEDCQQGETSVTFTIT